MPLPPNGTAWPPADLTAITPRLDEWSAWYSGDPGALRKAYQRTAVQRVDRPAQYRGGVTGAVARFWWGRPLGDLSQRQDQLHVPIAADLCQASADLLFSEPPTLTVDNPESQARLDVIADDGMHTTLAEAAEVAAALGGVYVRVTWDTALAAAPFLSVVDADAAWPEFRWGRLVAVTFWRTVDVNGQVVRRHLERHELAEGNGIILHGLYEGTPDQLGRVIPLTEHPSTAGLAVDDRGAIDTGTPGLAVEYVPNQRPQRRWRADPVGRHLGRSDLDGIEGPMDALDETYSSWMRDLRLGKARVLAARSLLDDHGPGMGASFDLDREVFSPVNALQSRDSSGLPIEPVQFAIRVAEHAATAAELTQVIVRSAGYSAQTFGEQADGAAITASEVTSRERRSYMTRDRKVRLWRPALANLGHKLLLVDQQVFSSRGAPDRPEVAFADAVQADPEALARTAQALRTARAASTRTLVAMQHPDWDDDAINQEVSDIATDDQLADPMAVVPPGAETMDPAEVKAAADAMGVLIRSGVDPDEAARRVGLEGMRFTGAVPTSLRLPAADADQLEQA